MAIQHKPLFHDLTVKKKETKKKNLTEMNNNKTAKLKSNFDDEKMEHYFFYISFIYFCAALNYHFRLSDFN